MDLITELLQKYETLSLHSANEAETRLKIIDRILFEILEWTHDDVSVEERITEDGETQYIDYLISTAGTSFILEAKKVGETFDSVPDQQRTRLVGNIVQGKTGDAIKQARDYSRKKSVPFSVVTNGAKWIIFPSTRIDQVSFANSTAIIFSSLNSVLRENYDEFAALLSRKSVIEGSLEQQLLGRAEDQLFQRRLGHFHTSRRTFAGPNPLYPLIEQSVQIAFSDSLSELSIDLLDKCYVNTSDRMKFDSRIKMYLSKRAPLFNRQPKRPIKKKSHSPSSSSLKYREVSLEASSLQGALWFASGRRVCCASAILAGCPPSSRSTNAIHAS